MSSKASAFCSLKQRTNQYHRWRCTDSFGELIERFISRFRSREKDLMPEDFDIQE